MPCGCCGCCGYNLPVADNLLDRQFSVQQPNRAYVGDITYLHTREGWLLVPFGYIWLLSSTFIPGKWWAGRWTGIYPQHPQGIKAQVRAKLVNDALLLAVWKRKPDKGLLWHTDRGSQYAADSHRKLLKLYGIRQSMSRKGNGWEWLPLGYNAVSESFFHLCPLGIP
jgi:putative transposase